jgi:hypothetical protein
MSIELKTTTLSTSVETSISIRNRATKICAEVLTSAPGLTEREIASQLSTRFSQERDLAPSGWYDPPPGGIAVLIGRESDRNRLRFDTLRNKNYWPGDSIRLEPNSCIAIYVSPFDWRRGILGDYGLTVHHGNDTKVLAHLRRCYQTICQAAEKIEQGMELREIYGVAKGLFKANGLNNNRTTTDTDPFGTNLGHTVPFTYEPPTRDEAVLISSRDQSRMNDLIRQKRLFINGAEKFKIPANIALTFEARLDDDADTSLPNCFYHLLVTFIDGRRKIFADFEAAAKAVGMTW